MQRPGSSSRRPGSSSGRAIGTALPIDPRGKFGSPSRTNFYASGNRPPGTATRLTTGMAPGTASGRAGLTGGGVGVKALSAQVTVTDRPVTQQGLGGVKTAAGRGPQRQIQDKTYFLGLLRSKINELHSEIGRLRKEADVQSEDQSSYVSYEKRAEKLAGEIKDLQGELGDYNTLVDKMNTDESTADIQMDYEDLRAQNDREAKALENLFEQKKEKEDAIRHLELELQQERSMADNLVAHMPDDMRMKYLKLKDTNEHLLRQLESSQQELDNLNMKKAELEEELAMSPVKQEAVRLYEQLHELEEKRDQLLEEQQSRGTPQQEREKLLKQVKEDNQEIASMERQTKELQEQITNLHDDVRQLDMDIEENQGERNQKYRELKKREETMNVLTLKQRNEENRMTDFLDSFEENKSQELERKAQLEQNIVMILEHVSRNLGRFQHMPTPGELANMRTDLDFKEGEMQKSKTTASGLAGESEKLAQDLQKVEQLESKITSELDQLKERIRTMSEEIEIYSDIDKLKTDAETRKNKLGDDKQSLYLRVGQLKKQVQQLAAQYETGKAELNQNETHAQLGNLERKWQHHEQNNFVMTEYIATKTMESDYGELSKRVNRMVSDYNSVLQGDTH